ncbi:hypothetical protein DM806_17140 [Sphingobium lactosutens]|nr:hypothetical protein [Sphingobium lactosutens]
MRFGLSGTAGFGLPGTRNTDFREHLISENPHKSAQNRSPSNYANRKEYFVFFLTQPFAVDCARCPALRRACRSGCRTRASLRQSDAAFQETIHD